MENSQAKRPVPLRDVKGEDRGGDRRRVVVKFHDHVEIPYRDGIEGELEKLKIGPWDRLAHEFPGATFQRLFTAMAPDKIRALMDRARELDRTYEPPNLLTYFLVDCPPGCEPQALAKALRAWPAVQNAYVPSPAGDPTVNDADDPLSPNQLYLDPAPTGLDAHYAWGFLGGDGQGQNVIDLEQGWTLNHEDLAAHGASVLFGAVVNGSRYHGTAVLGEICACDNTLDCVGIAPHVASVNVVSHSGVLGNIPNAVLAALGSLTFGDTLLIEVQLIDAPFGRPIETDDANFDSLRLATALGIIVVEAAGNGVVDLDAYTNGAGLHILQRGHADFRDSGAIVVGSCTAATPHARWTSSSYGSRIDCYGWGEQIDSLSSDAAGSTTATTTTFGGTSGASPMIVGAALVVQGIAEANLGYRLAPYQMRALLSDPANGTASANPVTDRIGVMPDLRAIIMSNAIGLAPDVYLRDNVADTGDPHSGSISSSPDIILVPATVPDPQAAYGEGSGTEGSNTLGDTVHPTHDNYIYVRARNRGGTAATGVAAKIYWSPAASLVTPDLWTEIGTATFPTVPAGDVLTVSAALTWLQADLPAAGHYCFVGLIGNDLDPAPNPSDFTDWDTFCRFIRENNNVTWRNFNVASSDPSDGADPSGFVALPFLVGGPPDAAREMRVEVMSRLPAGSRVLLELPLFLRGLAGHRAAPVVDGKRKTIRLVANPHGRVTFGPVLLGAKLRAQARLLVSIPKELRANEYELYVRQLYREQEVGRVTWRLVPKSRMKQG